MDRYIGLDAHTSSGTVDVVETNARAVVSIIEAIPESRRLYLEEGSLAGTPPA